MADDDPPKKTFTVFMPSWIDPNQKVKKDLFRKLDEISGATVEPSTRLASVTKEAAKLNAAVAESSSNATLAAAQIVAEALDRSTAAPTAQGEK